MPVSSPNASRQAARRGSTTSAAAARSFGRVVGGLLVPGPVDRFGVDSEGREEQEVVAGLEGERRDTLPHSFDPRPAADHAERDVGAQARRDRGVGAARPPQDGRGVGRASAQSAAERDPLGQPYRGPSPARGERPDHEVLLGERQLVGPRPGLGVDDEACTDLAGPAGPVEEQLVGQAERHHLGVELVVAVGAHAEHPQRHRELRGSQEPSHSAASLPHSATPSSSARASGRTPARSKAAGSTTPARERRSILRRWAKPARTTAFSRS